MEGSGWPSGDSDRVNVYAPPGATAPEVGRAEEQFEPRRGADFGVRLAARAIDYIWLTVLAMVSGGLVGFILAVLAELGHIERGWEHRLSDIRGVGILAGLTANVAYHTLSEGLHGASLGKFLCGLQVVSEDGSSCSMKAAFVRSAAFLIDGLFCGLIAFTAMKDSDRRQRYGDRWAQTVVAPRGDLPSSRRSVGRFLFAATVASLTAAIINGGLILAAAL
jgi:uncharacterized RDD family membrane protein YckC